MGQTESKPKQQPPRASPPPNPTPTTTTPITYLSTHLIIPYFITTKGEIKRPEHLIAWWSRIFSFWGKDTIQLRFLCRLFRDAIKPPPLWTSFPHPNYSTLTELMDTLNRVYAQDPKKAPKMVFILEGTFQGNISIVNIEYPLTIIGAGQDKTFLSGYSFEIKGKEEEGKRVVLKDFTSRQSQFNGLFASIKVYQFTNGLSFLCDSVTFTQCGANGVSAIQSKGRLINCVITQCGGSGIFCMENALVEVEGRRTVVQGNVTDRASNQYGLRTQYDTSFIHLLSPLTKESVSINNHGGRNYINGRNFSNGQNYGGDGTIETVDVFV